MSQMKIRSLCVVVVLFLSGLELKISIISNANFDRGHSSPV